MSRSDVPDGSAAGRRRRELGAVAFVLGVAAALVFSDGKRSAWPFSHWWLYHTGTPKPLDTIVLHQVRVLDEAGSWRRLWPRDLFTLDDDSSSQDMGHGLLARAVDPKNARRVQYQRALLRRVSRLLDMKPKQVEIWHLTWQVDYTKYPPLELENTIAEELALVLPGQSGEPP